MAWLVAGSSHSGSQLPGSADYFGTPSIIAG